MAKTKPYRVVLIALMFLTSCGGQNHASLRLAGDSGMKISPALQQWIAETERQAVADGVSPATVHAALDDFAPDARVLELDRQQPEKTLSFADYRRHIVNPARVRKGAALLRDNADILATIEKRTGVPPHIIVALWGIESNFGENTGDFETVKALATLAYEGRRADFFRSELVIALHILDQQHQRPAQLRGSWAGAMGQCQFMPSTYWKYAVDASGDGTRDIWHNPDDVLASIANYLSAIGWQRNVGWGYEVVLSAPLEDTEIGLGRSHSLATWAAKGVTYPDGSPLPSDDVQASLLQPDGAGGASFLVLTNMPVLMRWNHSTSFALAVGLLADEIAHEAQLSP